MEVYCKTCQKVLGKVADEKVPLKGTIYATCRTCNTKIPLSRAGATDSTESPPPTPKPEPVAAPEPTTADTTPHEEEASKPPATPERAVVPPSPTIPDGSSSPHALQVPFPSRPNDKGIKKSDIWGLFVMGIAVVFLVVLLVVFITPSMTSFIPSLPSPSKFDYEVEQSPENLPLLMEPVDTIGIDQIVRIRTLLIKGEFARLNGVLEEYQAAFERDQADEYKVFDAYRTFDSTDPSLESHLKTWRQRFPDHYQPYLATAHYYNALEWERRSEQSARDTSDEQIEDMKSYFINVEENVHRALEIKPNLMPAYELLIAISNVGGIGTDEWSIINNANKLFPRSYRVRVASVWAQNPSWGGSYALMEKIAKESEPHAESNPKLTTLYGRIYLDQADRLWHDDRDDEALERLGRALTFGENSSCYELRARIYYWHDYDEYERALEDINRAIELRPVLHKYYLTRLKVQIELGNYHDALNDLRTAERIKPHASNISEVRKLGSQRLVYKAYQAYENKDNDGAFEMYDMAILFDEKNHEAFYWRGWTRSTLGDRDAAFVDIERAIHLNPRHFDSYIMIDNLLTNKGRWEDIVPYWDAFLELEPDNGDAYLARSKVHHHNGDLDQALHDAERSCELGHSEGCEKFKWLKAKG